MGRSIDEGCVNYNWAFKEEGGYGNAKLFGWLTSEIGIMR